MSALQLDLSHNELCGLDYRGEGTYTAEGVTTIADALKGNASITSVNVLFNGLDMESANLLLKVKAEKPNLRTLCGLTHNETELGLEFRELGPGDAKLLTAEILVMSSFI